MQHTQVTSKTDASLTLETSPEVSNTGEDTQMPHRHDSWNAWSCSHTSSLATASSRKPSRSDRKALQNRISCSQRQQVSVACMRLVLDPVQLQLGLSFESKSMLCTSHVCPHQISCLRSRRLRQLGPVHNRRRGFSGQLTMVGPLACAAALRRRGFARSRSGQQDLQTRAR